MNLIVQTIKNAKPTTKTRKLFDGGGLYLEMSPKGRKWWRFRYRFGGKEKKLSLDVYPDVTLKEARDLRHQARKLLDDCIDPSEYRQSIRKEIRTQTDNTFELVAREWFSGHEPAHRSPATCGQVLRYAIATGRAERDITADLRGALPPIKRKHLAAVTEPERVAVLLRQIHGYAGSVVVRCAMQLAPLVFVRPGELRMVKWEDIDLETAEWRYVVSKTSTPHIVPLSIQAIELLLEIEPLSGGGTYVFPVAPSSKGESNE